MDNTDKLIKDQFDSLPLEIKEALERVPWRERVADIAKREGLNADQSAEFETETMLILYGFLSSESYTDNIQANVGVSDEQAERLAKLAGDEIFADIEKQYEMFEALKPKNNTLVEPVEPKPQPKLEENKGTPIGITPEIEARQIKMPEEPVTPAAPSTLAVPEIAPTNLPMVEARETAHEVPHQETVVGSMQQAVEEKAPASTPVPVTPAPPAKAAAEGEIAPGKPKSVVEEKLSHVVIASNEAAQKAYQSGKDPYREPLE